MADWVCVNCGTYVSSIQPSADVSGRTATGVCSRCRKRVGAVDDSETLIAKPPPIRDRETLPDDTWANEHWVLDGRGKQWIE